MLTFLSQVQLEVKEDHTCMRYMHILHFILIVCALDTQKKAPCDGSALQGLDPAGGCDAALLRPKCGNN